MLPDSEELLLSCMEIVRKSGKIITNAWNKPDIIHHKALTDLVTETDLAVQAFLQKELTDLLPEAAFIGEEGISSDPGQASPDKDLCWIVDPVDGTTNFVHRLPFVASSVALWNKGEPLLGIVNAPMLQELFYSRKNNGAFCNGKKLKVSSASHASEALVCTGFPYSPLPELPAIMGRLERIIPATQGLRRLGAAALDLSYVASGRLDAFYETCLKPWDMAAGVLLVAEAGGKVSDFYGQTYKFGQPLLADNGILHEIMLELVRPRDQEINRASA